MIVAAPDILSDEWMLIGRQEETGHGGRIDLLALAPDGALILIELKRNKTPRGNRRAGDRLDQHELNLLPRGPRMPLL